MNAKTFKAIGFGFLILAAFAASACGTMEIEKEPTTGMATVAATATALPLPTGTEVPLPTPTALPSPTPTSPAKLDEKIDWDAEITSLARTYTAPHPPGPGFGLELPSVNTPDDGSSFVGAFGDSDVLSASRHFMHCLGVQPEYRSSTDCGSEKESPHSRQVNSGMGRG